MTRSISQGCRVQLADGRQAIVSDASGHDTGVLVVLPLDPHWPFPRPPEVVLVEQCRRMPSRYHGEPRGPDPYVEVGPALF